MMRNSRNPAVRQFLIKRLIIPAVDVAWRTELGRYLAFLERSQWFSPEEIRTLQDEKLRAIVKHAYETVPLYRKLMDQRKLKPHDIRGTDDLGKLPIVDKQLMKQQTPHNTVSDQYDVNQLLVRRTSGSTGEPFVFYVSRQEKIMKRAAIARFWRWGGWDFGTRSVHVFSNPHSLLRRDGWPRRVEAVLLNRKFLPVNDLRPEYIEQIAGFQPAILQGYASGLYCLAGFAQERGMRLHLKGVITTAETLTTKYRRRMEEVYSARVFDEYGGEDMSFMAQCEETDLYHVNAENMIIELLRDGQPVCPGQTGEVVVTSLNRRAMPFIRYATRDLAVASARRCPCGRGLPVFERVEGRVADIIVSPSGRRISATILEYVFEHHPEIKLYQVIQPRPDLLVIKIVPDKGFGSHVLDRIKQDFALHFGDDFRLQPELVKDIKRTAAGKQRSVLVEFDDAQSADSCLLEEGSRR